MHCFFALVAILPLNAAWLPNQAGYKGLHITCCVDLRILEGELTSDSESVDSLTLRGH
jgi:hypothetical protein